MATASFGTAHTGTPGYAARVQALVAPTNARDFRGMVAPFDADAVFDTAAWHLGIYRGREAIRHLFEAWIGAFEDFHAELESVTDLGDGLIVADFMQTVRAQGAAERAKVRAVWLYQWRDGRVARVTTFHTATEALAAGMRLRG